MNTKMKISLEVDVPEEDWIDFLTKHNDIFSRNYSGYWLRGVEHDPYLGWLCWEDDEQHRRGDEPYRESAIACWKDGAMLPEGWYRLNKEMAMKAYSVGVVKWGEDWFEDKGDAGTYDVVIQLALLGEVRYG